VRVCFVLRALLVQSTKLVLFVNVKKDWLGHVDHKDYTDWLEQCIKIEYWSLREPDRRDLGYAEFAFPRGCLG